MLKHTIKLLTFALAIMITIPSLPLNEIFAASAKTTFSSANELKLTVNGQSIQFQYGSPFAKQGRSLVPLRDLLIALGVPNDDEHIIWDGKSQSVTAILGDTTIRLIVGDKTIMLNGQPYAQLEVAAETLNGRVYLPGRAVAEAFGYHVDYDSASSTILVTGSPNGHLAQSEEETEYSLTDMGYQDVKGVLLNSGVTYKEFRQYTLQFRTGGSPVEIYATDAFMENYGGGYAIQEIGPMILALAKTRQLTPYEQDNQTLKMFFYYDEPSIPFSTLSDVQTDWNFNNQGSGGLDVEIRFNGGKLLSDFRPLIMQQLSYYFDYYRFRPTNSNNDILATFAQYWSYGTKWMMEGAAIYSSHMDYTYDASKAPLRFTPFRPAITKNDVIRMVNSNNWRRTIDNLSFIDSFGKIIGVSPLSFDNDRSIAYSLYWYLSVTYGQNRIYAYADLVARDYAGGRTATKEMRDQSARSVFGKTEAEIILAWLDFFDNFNPLHKVTSANIVLAAAKGSPLPNGLSWESISKQDSGVALILFLSTDAESPSELVEFLKYAPKKFILRAEGKEDVTVATDNGKGRSMTILDIDADLQAICLYIITGTIHAGVTYQIEPVDYQSSNANPLPVANDVTVISQQSLSATDR